MPSGPYTGALVRNWGESDYFSMGQLNHGVTRSGSVSATYDDEGNAVSASGSLQLAHTYSGNAVSDITAWGKSVLGSESGTGTMVVATRNFSQGRSGSFNGGETSTLTPQLNSEGHIVFDTTSTGLTGTRSGGQSTTDIRSVYEIYNRTVQTSGNLYSLTDSGESPPGGGSSINYLLPSTDFADDPPPEQDASLSTGGLGYFASAFGFRGGIVGASFATALPGDPSLPNSTTFGELDFGGESWLQEPDSNGPPGTVFINDNMVDGVMSISVVAPGNSNNSISLLDLAGKLSPAELMELVDAGLATYRNGIVIFDVLRPDGTPVRMAYKYFPGSEPGPDFFDGGYGNVSVPANATLVGPFGAFLSDTAIIEAIYAGATLQNLQMLEGGLTFALYLVPGGTTSDQIGQGQYGDAAISAVEDVGLILIPLSGVVKNARVAKGMLRASVAMQGTGTLISAGQGVYYLVDGEPVQATGKAGETLLRLFGFAAARGQLRSFDATSRFATISDEAVFWSGIGRGGDKRAAAWVSEHGGATLETTLANRGIKLPRWNPDDPAVVAAWRQASIDFASGAKGHIRVLQGDSLRVDAIFRDEFNALIANPNVKSITSINPETGAEILLWSR